MQCKKMHGDRGRYLVNVGEKCNLMIPWTKVQKLFIAHLVQTTHKPLFYNFFLQLVSIDQERLDKGRRPSHNYQRLKR